MSRLWAAKARSGSDLRYNEKDVRAGRKLVVKLWNVGRFLSLNLDAVPTPAEPGLVDRWVLSHLADLAEATAAFGAHDFMQAHQAVSRTFWSVYCDRYLEMIKDQVGSDPGTRRTLWESYRVLLGLFSPFATEELYQRFYRAHEGAVFLHLTPWPAPDPRWETDRAAADQMAVTLDATRARSRPCSPRSPSRCASPPARTAEPAPARQLHPAADTDPAHCGTAKSGTRPAWTAAPSPSPA